MNRRRHLFAPLLTALLTLALMLPLAAPAALGAEDPGLSGSGTASDPWMIYTAEDLQTAYTYIAQACDDLPGDQVGIPDCFRLGADITLEKPIIIYNNVDYDLRIALCGTFDGNGHTINNFSLKLYPNKTYGSALIHTYPLFPVNFGTIENLTVVLASEYGNLYKDPDYGILCGGLVCDNFGTIRNCRVEGSLGGAGLKGPAGLIAGLNGNGGKIIDCSASGKIFLPSKTYAYQREAGGIVGVSHAGTATFLAPGEDVSWSSSNGVLTNDAGMDGLDAPLIQNCTADVYITANWTTGMGGIVGETDKYTVVEGCTANVDLNAGGTETYNTVGGIVGDCKGTVRSCTSSGKITLTSTAAKTPSAVGGVVGTAQSGSSVSNCSSTAKRAVSDLNAYNGDIVGRDNGASLSGNSVQGGQTAKPEEITVTVNGVQVVFDQPPIAENNRVLVPVRAIFEAMGAEVTWNQASMTAFAVRGDTTVAIQIGNRTMYRGQTAVNLDVPAKALNGRTLVPVRAVSEAFNADVDWDSARNRVVISISGSTQLPDGSNQGGSSSGQGNPDRLPDCILCNNSGMRRCNFCRGDGRIVDPYYDILKDGIRYIDCPYCDGAGQVPCLCGHRAGV